MNTPVSAPYAYDKATDTVTYKAASAFSGSLQDVAKKIDGLDKETKDDASDGKKGTIARFSTENFKKFLNENSIPWDAAAYEKFQNVFEKGFINHRRAAQYIKEVTKAMNLADFLVQQDNAAPEKNNFWSNGEYVRIYNKDTFGNVLGKLGLKLDDKAYKDVQKNAVNSDKIINLSRAAKYIRTAKA